MIPLSLDRPTIEISPEKIREAAWELWQEVADGTMSENDGIEDYDEIIKKVLEVVLRQDKDDS